MRSLRQPNESIQRDEMLERLESVVCHALGVSGAVYFGSIAKGSADAFSDIDLLVRCDDGTAFDIAAALHAELEIILYRPFSSGREPSGRYWFSSTHPFLRLDVSFHGPEAFDELLRDGGEFARAPFSTLEIPDDRNELVGASPPSWPIEDQDFALALRLFQESGKALARGETPKRPLHVVEKGIHDARSDNLRLEAWNLYERSWVHLQRAGLDRVEVIGSGGSA